MGVSHKNSSIIEVPLHLLIEEGATATPSQCIYGQQCGCALMGSQ